MPERNNNLWAPWRLEYIQSVDQDAGCFLCRYWGHGEADEGNLVVCRGGHTMIVLNRYPYTNGHLMIAPGEHIGDFTELSDEALSELGRMTRHAVRLLDETIHPHGYNIGMNLARCAGAGVPDHIHAHVVPRWNGDTNYMAVVGDVRVIPQALDVLHRDLLAACQRLGPPC